MTIIYFVLILGITVFIHELGHFLFAKKSGVHVYEFSIGMGPKLYSFNRKNDMTNYSIRLFPIGGFVRLAGEDLEDDKTVPKNSRLQDKSISARFLTLFMGAGFNFLLAIVLLFIIGLFYGVSSNKPIIKTIEPNYPFAEAGIKIKDRIIEINGKKVRNIDEVLYEFAVLENNVSTFTIERGNKDYTYKITPKKMVENKETVYKYGFTFEDKVDYGLIVAIKYAFVKTYSLFIIMFKTIGALFTGNVALNQMTGPVGLFGIVSDSAEQGFGSILYLIAFLSINVGFINLIPFPAFDGGRLLFLVIEKFKGKPVTPEIENMIHNIGFILLIMLMLVVTFNDIVKLF